MKWNHDFVLTGKGTAHRVYTADDIEARFDFLDHMLRVAIVKKDVRLFPTFTVCPGTSVMPRHGRHKMSLVGLNTNPQGEEIKIDDVSIEIDPHNLRITYKKDGKILFQDREGLAYNLDGELGRGAYHYVSREEGEKIFGLGDKTGDVNKAGRRFKMETFDTMGFDANSSDPLYKQVPFYICENSVGSYGLYYDTYSSGEFDFGREHNNYYQHYKYAHFEADALVYYVIFGSTKEILSRFMHLTGKAALPPKWSFSYCGSTMAYTDAPDSEKQLRNFLSLIQKYDLDCGGFYLSSGYTQIGDKRCVFHWNKEKIPDPKRLAEDFKKAGIHFLPNVKPAFLKEHPLYKSIAEKGWFLHYSDGTPATFPFWGGEASYLDFTNDDASSFWTDCVKKNLVDLGYESIWNDNNEYDVHDEDIWCEGFGDPIQAKRIRPLFPLLMTRASRDAIDSDERVMAVSRSGVAGQERYAQTWTGDNRTSWEDFRGNHKMAMTMALSGYRFFGQDIGGFAGPRPDQELFLRWIQYGIFTPRFTLHSWNEDGSSNMPWLYPELIEEVKKLFALREHLIPYIFSEANKAVDQYKALIRPVFLEEPGFDVESDEFFLGGELLACPVFDKGKDSVEVTLPKGKWYRGEEVYEGKLTVPAPVHGLPVYFLKAGTIIPTKEGLEVYALEEGEFKYRYYDDESLKNRHRTLKVSCRKGYVKVTGALEGERIILHDAWHRPLK